jgi:hypothetical protein
MVLALAGTSPWSGAVRVAMPSLPTPTFSSNRPGGGC